MTTALARNTDPTESHKAARKTKADTDRFRLLHHFYVTLPLTYRAAALSAASEEGTENSMIRVETFRKRGSDLKGLGYIVQTGTEDGQATFKLTEKGWLSVVRGSL